MFSRGDGQVRFVKVVGHATSEQVGQGLVMQEDKDGNDAADKLATAAADAHSAPGPLIERAESRRQMAVATHNMMVSIMTARSAFEQRLGLANAHLVPDDDG